MRIIVAIDGYSSSGKSTMARRLAKRVGYRYVDTGAMYRAVTLYALDRGIESAEMLESALENIRIDFAIAADGSQHTMLNGADVENEIRSMRVSEAVSMVAAIGAVRRDLVRKQQAMGKDKGVVMDGRDIGTAVFPMAELKIFVDASAQTRAMRRYKEMREKGIAITYEEVLANVESRDEMDRNRSESPLRRAEDAIVLDNSNMSIEEQDAWVMEQFERVSKGYES